MDFEYVSFVVKEIYKEKKIPSEPGALGTYLYSDTAECLHEMDEKLKEVKGVDSWKELKNTYVKFARDIHNNNMVNLGPIRRVLRNKLNELEVDYFETSRPLMKFLVNGRIGKKIYSVDSDKYWRLSSMLCHMNILGYKKLIADIPEIFKIFTSTDILWELDLKGVGSNEEVKDLVYPLDKSNSYLLNAISRSENIVLQYKDIERKLGAVDRIVQKGMFDFKETEVNGVETRNNKDEVFKEELNSYLKKSTERLDTPPKEKLEDWIRQLAKSISKSKKSKIEDSRTIELYLENLVNFPRAGVLDIKNKIDNDCDLPECDSNTLDDLTFNAFRGWEKRFFTILTDHCFEEFAQRFKRY